VNQTCVCPVCGYDGLDVPAYDVHGLGSYHVCPCCVYEYGVTDHDARITHEQWRQRWVDEGMPWRSGAINAVPAGWNPRTQLARVTG